MQMSMGMTARPQMDRPRSAYPRSAHPGAVERQGVCEPWQPASACLAWITVAVVLARLNLGRQRAPHGEDRLTLEAEGDCRAGPGSCRRGRGRLHACARAHGWSAAQPQALERTWTCGVERVRAAQVQCCIPYTEKESCARLDGELERVQEAELRRLRARGRQRAAQVGRALAATRMVPAHHRVERACARRRARSPRAAPRTVPSERQAHDMRQPGTKSLSPRQAAALARDCIPLPRRRAAGRLAGGQAAATAGPLEAYFGKPGDPHQLSTLILPWRACRARRAARAAGRACRERRLAHGGQLGGRVGRKLVDRDDDRHAVRARVLHMALQVGRAGLHLRIAGSVGSGYLYPKPKKHHHSSPQRILSAWSLGGVPASGQLPARRSTACAQRACSGLAERSGTGMRADRAYTPARQCLHPWESRTRRGSCQGMCPRTHARTAASLPTAQRAAAMCRRAARCYQLPSWTHVPHEQSLRPARSPAPAPRSPRRRGVCCVHSIPA